MTSAAPSRSCASASVQSACGADAAATSRPIWTPPGVLSGEAATAVQAALPSRASQATGRGAPLACHQLNAPGRCSAARWPSSRGAQPVAAGIQQRRAVARTTATCSTRSAAAMTRHTRSRSGYAPGSSTAYWAQASMRGSRSFCGGIT